MTPDEIKALQANFARVYPVKHSVAKSFYDKLFDLAPEVRDLFPEDMRAQREKLADTLAFIVKHLNQPDKLELAVASMARRHVGYGAVSVHLPVVGAALLYALEEQSAGKMTRKEHDAWAKAYQNISDLMVAELP
ncbi:MAG: globin domain-containing protein [Heliomarina sp.]|uniref:globin domain-containing protein n=1 Tax=Heliomarina TaxID=2917553 RepID=UPI001EE34E3C|nr:globin domain-containing protein [Heliomarina baculiformis]